MPEPIVVYRVVSTHVGARRTAPVLKSTRAILHADGRYRFESTDRDDAFRYRSTFSLDEGFVQRSPRDAWETFRSTRLHQAAARRNELADLQAEIEAADREIEAANRSIDSVEPEAPDDLGGWL